MSVPLASLIGLFGAFVAVQLAVLFGGHDHVVETAGLTYAEYARGFWELLVAGAHARRDRGCRAACGHPSPPPGVALKGMLGALCALTLVVLASALHRLNLYEDTAGSPASG